MGFERFGRQMLVMLMLVIIGWGAYSCAAEASCKGPECRAVTNG
jgi:hypothetical protein